MSLPLAFKTTMETIPAKVPYLAVSESAIEKWRSKLNGAELKVGVAWAGNPNHAQDLDRSIPLKNILPILGVKGARYFSLQKDLRHGDKEILDVNSQIVRLDPEINDFEDTAAIMMSLDLVISCDTSIVILLAPWVDQFGCCCRLILIGDGCWTAVTRHGIRPQGYSGRQVEVNGRQLPTMSVQN